MANFVFTNGYVMINSVNLSVRCKSARLNTNYDIVDNTTMSATAHSHLAGLHNWSMDFEFTQDFVASGANSVDATIGVLTTTAVTVACRPDAGAIATTNPEYTGSAFLESYTLVGNGVGEDALATARFIGTGALTRDVTP